MSASQSSHIIFRFCDLHIVKLAIFTSSVFIPVIFPKSSFSTLRNRNLQSSKKAGTPLPTISTSNFIYVARCCHSIWYLLRNQVQLPCNMPLHHSKYTVSSLQHLMALNLCRALFTKYIIGMKLEAHKSFFASCLSGCAGTNGLIRDYPDLTRTV